MSKKSKTEKDYEDYNAAIEQKAQEEIENIRRKIRVVKKEAQEIGDSLQSNTEKATAEEQEKS